MHLFGEVRRRIVYDYRLWQLSFWYELRRFGKDCIGAFKQTAFIEMDVNKSRTGDLVAGNQSMLSHFEF
ncbi:MAG: hypothetical protein QGG54_22455, partial [Gammaproteobacteria bacterium]|nr:hypothetical protein [Gammaproteobacteria bacterium]